MSRISVVVPARDVEQYVAAVLRDLQNQTFKDFEVIVVDDGSHDATRDIIDSFAESDGRFRHFSSDGAGVSAARNLGVAHANGEFLAFVDADDRISRDYLRKLHASLVATGSELVSANARRLIGFRTSPSMLHRRACDQPRQRTHLTKTPSLVWDTTVWNKLWRRTMWERAGIHYSEGRWLNDFLPSIQGHVASRQVDVLGDVVYFWRVRDDPTTSITDRRLTDQQARHKSFADRSFAMNSARALLATQLPVRRVLNAFDYRILHNDLPMYLPYYVDSDDDYRHLLMSGIGDMLERFNIQPNRFALGPILQRAYKAIQEADHDRLMALLSRETHLAPSSRHRQRTELIVSTSNSATSEKRPSTKHGPTRSLLRKLHLRWVAPAPMATMAYLDQLTVDAPAPGHLTVHGAVRIREGRSDVAADWTVNVRLDGLSNSANLLRPRRWHRRPWHPHHRGPYRRRFRRQLTRVLRVLSLTTRLVGDNSPTAAAPDATLHPLIRSGWLPFRASINLTQARQHPAVSDWTLGIEVRAGRVRTYAIAALGAHATRALPPAIQVADNIDLVPHTYGTGQLHLRRSPVRATAPATSDQLASNWHLATPGTPSGGQLEVHTHRLDLRWIAPAAEVGTVAVGGAGDPTLLGAKHLVLHCPWTDERLLALFEPAEGGWRAEISALELAEGDATQTRMWSLTLLDRAGNSTGLWVPPELRNKFPLCANLDGTTVYALLGRQTPALSLRPVDNGDKWPKLRRLQSSVAQSGDSQPSGPG